MKEGKQREDRDAATTSSIPSLFSLGFSWPSINSDAAIPAIRHHS